MKNLIFIFSIYLIYSFSYKKKEEPIKKDEKVEKIEETLKTRRTKKDYDVDSAKRITDYVFTRHIYNKERNQEVLNFIKRFDYVALLEYNKYGILPSITLAQGLLESGIGKSTLAKECNAYFGVKKGNSKINSRKYPTYEIIGNKKVKIKDDFLCFNTPWESFRNHSLLLQKKRYKKVKYAKNYKKATKALKKAGYFTSKIAEKSLNSIIEKYNLFIYDKL